MFKVEESNGKLKADKVCLDFLSSLLIEVVTENYRQMMFEQLMLGAKSDVLLDPPLRANEAVMSGLFSTALSRVTARSKPEVRIGREGQVSGHVDFLAWYNKSTIALELKMAVINWANPTITEVAKNRWDAVVNQADDARKYFEELQPSDRYPDVHSIGLLVLVSRSATDVAEFNANDRNYVDEVVAEVRGEFSKNTPPAFIATYEMPSEFGRFARNRKGIPIGNEARSTPFVTFIAHVAK